MIFTSFSLSYSLSRIVYPFYCLSILLILPPLKLFHTFLLSPFHVEEQLLRVPSLSLSLSLCPPLPLFLSSLPLLDPGGITLSEPNVPQTCQMMFVFHPLAVPLFQHACVF